MLQRATFVRLRRRPNDGDADGDDGGSRNDGGGSGVSVGGGDGSMDDDDVIGCVGGAGGYDLIYGDDGGCLSCGLRVNGCGGHGCWCWYWC